MFKFIFIIFLETILFENTIEENISASFDNTSHD